jgi:large subunit ribosomal protein L7/L12
MADLEKIVEQLSALSVLEAAELVKKLEEKWGVSAAAPVAMAVAGAAPAAVAEAVEEQTEFDVVIKDPGPKKIEVIKVIRQLVNLSLTEAKAMAETADGKVMVASKRFENGSKKGDPFHGSSFFLFFLTISLFLTHLLTFSKK